MSGLALRELVEAAQAAAPSVQHRGPHTGLSSPTCPRCTLESAITQALGGVNE